jgi:hypothetical protein
MSLIPHRFLFRMAHPCPYVKGIPLEDGDELFELPESGRIDNFAAMDDRKNFAEISLAWNDFGLAFQAIVKAKDQEPQGDAAKPRGSDSVSLFIDTRDARTSHRASRYCHHFYFLPTGGGPELDEPTFGQMKIHRALQDAPLCNSGDFPFRCDRIRSGYKIQAFLPAAVLNGYDPEQNPRLGFFYWVHDNELGDQTLGVGSEFPYIEDPSLWSVLELVRSV